MTHTFTRTQLGIYSTVSEQLRKGREQRELSLEECAKSIHIQPKFLQALEESKFDELPGEMYTRAWIRKYATYLDLDLKRLMISYDKERTIRNKATHDQKTSTFNVAHQLWDFFTMRRLIILFAALILLGYVGVIIYQTISQPRIVLNIPLTGFRTQSNSIIIKGQTETGALVQINQQPIALDAHGIFEQELTLRDGLNTVHIEAQKKHSLAFIQDIPIIKTSLPGLQTATSTGP